MSEFGFLQQSGWGAFLFILIALSMRLFWGVNKDEGRGRWVAWVRHDRLSRRYREILNASLDRVDRFLSPDFPLAATDSTANRKIESTRAWSTPLLYLCLRLSVAYPTLAVFLEWTLSAQAVEIGNQSFLPASVDGWLRWFVFACIALAYFLAAIACVPFAGRMRRVRQLVAIVSLVCLYGAAVWVAGYPAISVAIVISLFFAIVLSFFFVISITFVANSLDTYGIKQSPSQIDGIYDTLFKQIYFIGASSLAFSFAVTGAFSLLFVQALAWVQFWIGRRLGRPTLALIAFTIILLFGIWGLVRTWNSGNVNVETAAIILFLGFLPLLNALADFISVGLTRWRLRIGIQSDLVLNALVDVVAALIILIALAIAMVATLHVVRTGDGVPLYDARSLLTNVRAKPSNYWWIAFMLFSTLIPTLAHLAIGTFALFTLVSGWLGRPIAAGLMKGDSPEGRLASILLTLAAALAIWLPCLLIWLCLTHAGGPLLDAVLWACERFLDLLNAYFPLPHTAAK